MVMVGLAPCPMDKCYLRIVFYISPSAWHLQKGDLDNKHRGKAVKYCELLLAANPLRPFALCVLTNTVELEVYKATRSTAMEGPYQVERSSVVTMAGTSALSYSSTPACH